MLAWQREIPGEAAAAGIAPGAMTPIFLISRAGIAKAGSTLARSQFSLPSPAARDAGIARTQ